MLDVLHKFLEKSHPESGVPVARLCEIIQVNMRPRCTHAFPVHMLTKCRTPDFLQGNVVKHPRKKCLEKL